MPTSAAVVAAPILKLWPAYCCCGRPTAPRMVLSCVTNQDFVTGTVEFSLKKGPGWAPRDEEYSRMAATGHIVASVRPTTTSDPVPNWSHLDFFRWICTILGPWRLSIATSPHARWVAGLNEVVSGSNSPSRKNPKNLQGYRPLDSIHHLAETATTWPVNWPRGGALPCALPYCARARPAACTNAHSRR